eukprot:CAMPEP_0181332016 /NCGR_PEP_ID=MMETSP1101-20121128/24843_1 /TAXON_ID=46948 /ORGANISM="Rhodomonas abbreviata, Strain Caron Lab Isolate" /LENGTH=61 /DNA_ID=CAMNT_0023441581 /DNA_START=48 /DNA_END=233 /DNA_ORIENTATION=+
MVNKVRASQALFGKFFANVHEMGPRDGMWNALATGFAVGGLAMSTFSFWSLMGNGKKIEGR